MLIIKKLIYHVCTIYRKLFTIYIVENERRAIPFINENFINKLEKQTNDMPEKKVFAPISVGLNTSQLISVTKTILLL